MSNLYKSQFIIKSETEKRVINSNDKIAERMQEYIAELKHASLGTDGRDGFVAGINAENVEVLDSPEMQESDGDYFQQGNDTFVQNADDIIEEAKREADEIIRQAKEEAINLKQEVFNAAKEEGMSAATAEANLKIEAQQRELQELMQKHNADYHAKVQSIEADLIDVISEVFDNVFRVQFKDQKEVLLYLVEKAMMSSEGCSQFRIHLSKEKYPEILQYKEDLLEHIGMDVRIDIIEDMALTEDQCLIETDCGVFDCGVGTQMQNLKKELKTLCL